MASASAPATPANTPTQLKVQGTPTGTWRHPRLDEITRRQNATTFTDRNVRIIAWNGLSLFLTWAVSWISQSLTPQLYDLFHPLPPYLLYALWLLRLVLGANVSWALLPLIRPHDELLDIPLTPNQRALLGLKQRESAPATPNAQYVTPPRYARSATPRSTPGSQNGSPLSNQDTPSRVPGSGSPFSPSSSPMLQKALGGSSNKDLVRRGSFGSPTSSLGVSTGSFFGGMPSTPSPPSGNTRSSLGLNSKWLYERNRGSPGSGKVYY